MGIDAKSEPREVSAAAVSVELKAYARQRWPLDNDKSRKALLRKLLGFTGRRMRSLYEGEGTAVPRGSETAAIEDLIGRKIGAAADEENRDAFMALQARVARLEAALAVVDEAFFDPQMAAYREALHGGRRGNEPGETD